MPGAEADVHILLVEDDTIDVIALKRALQQRKLTNPLTVARDGVEALEILRGGPDRPPLPRPYMILLDLSLPRMNGIEFLETLRADPALQDAIVFMLTTSRADEDRSAAYRLNVAGYMVKSDLSAGLLRVVTMLESYWRVVEFP
jgi:CheY-like chemotaxis protein